ncbi:MAG: S8 family peptidase [Pseudomonadota bacterium]
MYRAGARALLLKPRFPRLDRVVALLFLLLTPLGAASADGEESLLVMLQGIPLPPIETAIENVGGHITHRLPLIDAVGAQLTRSQLDTVLESTPSIGRVIDDLAWEPEPEPPIDPNCSLAGAIELNWEASELRWRLFNKGDVEVSLSRIDLAWPASLGQLEEAALGDETLEPLPDGAENEGSWTDLAGIVIEARSQTDLSLRFANPPGNPPSVQSEISLDAISNPECGTSLVPSYEEPGNDSYFPSVSGASSLHKLGITGEGIGIAVLDSGLWEDPTVIAMNTRGERRVRGRFDAMTGRVVDLAEDESGHGTHIASVIARSDRTLRVSAPNPSFRGVAPNAALIVVKAFGRDGTARLLDLVRGVQWAVTNRERFGIQVLNLSFASRPRWPYWQDPVNQALLKAWEAGIFVVAAAGNEGPEPMSIGSPGNLPYLLTVGAVTDSWTEGNRNDDYVPDFSSRGPTPLGHLKPDIVAPGGHISGITPPTSSLAADFPEYFLSSGEFVMTGSSQAAGVMSGLAALMLELEPDLTNDELKCLLVTSAEPAIEPDGRLSYSPFVQGAGIANIRRALTLGSRNCDQNDLNIKKELSGLDHFIGPAIFEEGRPPRLPGGEELIADPQESEGPSTTRRWGAAEHLQRLSAPDPNSPIDWQSIFQTEQRLVRELADEQR